MRQYLSLLEDVLKNGDKRMDRTGTGTVSVFGRQLRFNLRDGFPLVTTKKIHYKSVLHELLWFLSGTMNIKYLQDNGVRIWNEWADEDGYVGPIYGTQWRNWMRHVWTGGEMLAERYDGIGNRNGIDQLQNVINTIRANPTDRRMIVSAWNPAELDDMKLPPCHIMYQFYVRQGRYLDIQVYQRSADVFLGVPFDIASYATLLCMVAHITGYDAGELIYNFGDTHIYLNHIDQVFEQLEREPRALPLLYVRANNGIMPYEIDDFKYGNLELVGYDPYPAIKAEVSV